MTPSSWSSENQPSSSDQSSVAASVSIFDWSAALKVKLLHSPFVKMCGNLTSYLRGVSHFVSSAS